eukprot:1153286-Pelagomonas_calceolata.AAC.1
MQEAACIKKKKRIRQGYIAVSATRANRVRQPHQLHVNQRHVHLIEIKYCEDTRPGQQLEAAQRQHTDLNKLISAKVVSPHTILLGVGGTCYTDHTLNQFKQLGLDHQRAPKLAQKSMPIQFSMPISL